jgi:hypothetical protein
VARDFAKGKQGGNRKPPARKKPVGARQRGQQQARVGGGWRWYGAGVLTGVFLSFLLYLGTLPGPGESHSTGAGNEMIEEPAPKPRFDFYTLLPEQTIDVELEPGEIQRARASAPNSATSEQYLLQAGSFRQREDADRRRAELLLLGLEPRVEEARGDNGRWYRVYLGPYESRAKMAKARSLTAGQDIDTLLLKRGAP